VPSLSKFFVLDGTFDERIFQLLVFSSNHRLRLFVLCSARRLFALRNALARRTQANKRERVCVRQNKKCGKTCLLKLKNSTNIKE